MRQLLLLRHAHATDARAGTADIDRHLSARGRAEALDAAQCIAAAGLRCDALLVSPAVRTRQTATLVAAELDIDVLPRIEPSLYLADATALLRALVPCADRLECVLLVAHNPGISELAQRFKDASPPLQLRTAGLCLIRFDTQTGWAQLQPQLALNARVLR